MVDDSPALRSMVARLLEKAGYRVRTVGDGIEALQTLASERFDVVISDLSMPGFDGFALLRAIRALPEPPEVIFLTGALASDFSSAVRALRLGAHDYLSKPPCEVELLSAVCRAGETRRLRDENRRLLRELERQTRTDPLTGAGNRRAFSEAVRVEMSRSRRYGKPLGIAVFDLDHFKATNDAWGHAGGDAVLCAFADRARAVFRDADVLFRVGGEEFAVLLPSTDTHGAVAAAERLLAALRETPVVFGDALIPVTASAGVSILGPGGDDGEELFSRADGALYAAKRAGRDQARLHVGHASPAPAPGEQEVEQDAGLSLP